jgi:proteasome lid subunit RPN8/RPN11
MTNEEWMASTRPDGNVDPQPESESGLPEGGYSTPEKEGDEKNKELSVKIEKLNADERLKTKVKEIFDSFYQKTNRKENGWIRTAKNVYGPSNQESTQIKYDWRKIEKGITEWYHSHPTGAPIPSAADLSLLTSRYTGGYLDVDNFSYGVISEFGCTTFIIISEEDFKAFAESFSYDKMKEELNQFYLNNRGGAETIVSAFSDFLDRQNTGLELIFNPYDQSTNEWGGWKVL